MCKGILMIKMQLLEKCITDLKKTIRDLIDWYVIAKTVDINENKIYNNKRLISSIYFNLEFPTCLINL